MVKEELTVVRNTIKKLEGFPMAGRDRILDYVNAWHEEEKEAPQRVRAAAQPAPAVNDDIYDSADDEDFDESFEPDDIEPAVDNLGL